jgi:hypothetical protein
MHNLLESYFIRWGVEQSLSDIASELRIYENGYYGEQLTVSEKAALNAVVMEIYKQRNKLADAAKQEIISSHNL